MLRRFTDDNPGIAVSVNTVPCTAVRDQLRAQDEAGQAPDMTRISDLPSDVMDEPTRDDWIAALNAYALEAPKFQDQAVAMANHRLAGSL